MIRNLYDLSIVAYKTGTGQTVICVLDTIHLELRKEKKRVTAELQLTQRPRISVHHSSILPSNTTESIYRHKPDTFAQANEMIDNYRHFYNLQPIQKRQEHPRSNGVAPADHFILLYTKAHLCAEGSSFCCNRRRFSANMENPNFEIGHYWEKLSF